MQFLAEKYAPANSSEIVGQTLGLTKVKEFLLRGKRPKKAMMLFGPTGVGKTCSISVIARELGFDIVRLTPEDVVDEDYLLNAVTTASIFGNNKLILIDELESFPASMLSKLLGAIRRSRFPIVLVALDFWSHQFRHLRPLCEAVEFKKLLPSQILARLSKVAEKEGIVADKGMLNNIANSSDGDLRVALNDMGLLSKGYMEQPVRDAKIDVFSALQKLFRSENAENASNILDSVDMDFEMMRMWVAENIANEYKTPEEIAGAYDKLSRSDVFSGRIRRRQHQGLFYYANLLATAGVSSSKRTRKSGFVRYARPGKLSKLYESKQDRELVGSVSRKLSRRTHSSTKIVERDYLTLLKFMLRTNQSSAVVRDMGLDKEEVVLLSGR
jgi:replication factor C large subunit